MLIRLLRRALPPYAAQVVLVAVLLLIQSVANLYLPNLNADIINNGVAKGDTNYIWRTGAVMLAVTLGLGVLAIVGVYFASRVSMGVGRDLRSAVFRRVQSFSAREVSHFGTPSLITRNTNDVQQVQLFLQIALTIMVSAPIMAVGGVIMAVREDATLSWLLIVIVPLMAGVIGLLLVKAVPLFRAMQTKIDRITQVLREQITGVRVARAFIRVPSERRRFEVANADLTDTALRVNRIFALAFPSLLAIMNLSTVAILWFGAELIDRGDMPIGNLTAFLMYILQILFAVMTAVFMVILVPRAEVSAQRIVEVLDTTSSIADPAAPVVPARPTGVVELRDVTFAYPHSERPVLQGLSFEARPGKTTAIIGGTGSGKTTVVTLLTRGFDVTSGAVQVDGIDIREQSLERLWSRIGLVPQAAYLFKGTVAENLRFGNPNATEAELWRALEIAQARDFVAAMRGGLEAPIDQGGTNVSGGQRQRLAIARAIVKRPAIYLFDDCFSALDAATDARLRLALKSETADATVLIVAQRVSTILHADHIVVLDEGRVVGSGTHAELVRTSAEYREIVESQLGSAAA
ncbi:MAG TPA: ABC transporter ATP-binding protein [Candidatus Limnocylindria bacterium]|nr:ABC transporter ATP-binding protein [Candidatus Limnocylindria bacterium]